MSIRGRQRLGKTRLAEEFAKEFTKTYVVTARPPGDGISAQDQRKEFARQLRAQGIALRHSDNWFGLLCDFASHSETGRILIVLDEIMWMGSLDHMFLGILKTVWDTRFSRNPHLIFIVAGSNAAWIEKHIHKSTGFFGRFSRYLHLGELTLPNCDQFWGPYQDEVTAYEKLKVFAATGGVPGYLEHLRPDRSAEQNLLDLCYKPNGILFNEFDANFGDLFGRRSTLYKKILNGIAMRRPTMGELAHSLGIGLGGNLSGYLEELIEAGFVVRDSNWNIGKQRRERFGHYRISDNYTRFYIKYIEPYRDQIIAGKIRELPKQWTSILGLQLHNLVANNWFALFRAIKFDPADLVWCDRYMQTPTTRRQGCQIDYLIQTKHRELYVCEIKFEEEKIGTSVIKEVAEKSRKLAKPKGFSVRHVLIHVNGVTEQVEWENFFSNIVDFGQLLSDG